MRQLFRRAWHAVRHRHFEADLAEEMEFHRALKQSELEGTGLKSSDASLATRRALGSVALTQDCARDVWVWPWLQDILQDIRFATRLLAKDRWFTLVAVLALGLGIGVNNTLFTIVNALCIRGLPIDRPDRVMYIGSRDVRDHELGVSFRDFEDMRSATRAFAGMAAFTGAQMPVGDEGRAPDRVLGTYISASAFRLTRQQPLLGRDFLPEEDQPGAHGVVILGNGIWKTRYGGDPSVIGQTIRVNGVPSVVIGVMPDRFKFPNNADLWQPLALMPGLTSQGRDVRSLSAIGRLAQGATVAQAGAELNTVATRLSDDYSGDQQRDPHHGRSDQRPLQPTDH